MHTDLRKVYDEVKSGVAILVDVREEEEWAKAHLEGAVHLPLSKIECGDPCGLPCDRQVYLYCRRGNRVKKASALLIGSITAHPLPWSFEDLWAAGFPVEQ